MIRTSSRLLSTAAALAVVALAACAHTKPAGPAQTVQTTGATVPNAPVPGMVLDTSEIFGILHEEAKADLVEAKLAAKKASDPRVKAFAEEVAKDADARAGRQKQLMDGLGISKPAETMIGVHVREVEKSRLRQLASLSGSDFDRAFLDGQIDNYRSLFETYDKDLVPNAKDPQIKESLEIWRARAERRLGEAQRLRDALGAK
jgi:putative membrane protein